MAWFPCLTSPAARVRSALIASRFGVNASSFHIGYMSIEILRRDYDIWMYLIGGSPARHAGAGMPPRTTGRSPLYIGCRHALLWSLEAFPLVHVLRQMKHGGRLARQRYLGIRPFRGKISL